MAVQASLREDIVKLLVYSVNTPTPNIAHLLLGYDITKPLQETNLQDPGESDNMWITGIYELLFTQG